MQLYEDSEIHKVIDDKFKDCVPAWVWAEVEMQPTRDFVEVVRCKDCKHWRSDRANIHRGDCLEIVPEAWMNENDFCSYGEKKDE